MADTRSDKERFFAELELLDRLSDDSGDDEFSRVIALSRPAVHSEGDFGDGGEHNDEIVVPAVPVRRATTPAILPSSSLGTRSLDGGLEDSEGLSTEHARPLVRRSNTTGLSIETTKTMTASKRKRVGAPKVVPEHLQVFKGLVFFFFPNSDVSPLRRLRIQKAEEYGALRAKAWGNGITHVIVDKGLTFQDVLKHLKLETFPADIALLDGSYPAECIKFQSLLSTTHLRFRVSGMPGPAETKEPGPGPEPSKGRPVTEQLPLKPSRRQQPPQTPSQDSPVTARHIVGVEHRNGSSGEAHAAPICEPFASRERDMLDDMIDEAKAVKDLPLEPMDYLEGDSGADVSDVETPEASDSEPAMRKKRKYPPKDTVTTNNWQKSFACMQAHDARSSGDSPNGRTIEVLQQMLDYYTRTDDHWRVLAYRKAITALRRQTKKIATRAQAFAIPSIGPRLADKIEEIVFTNRLRRLENTNSTPEDRILQEFMGVYGAGLSQASRWLAQGYKSLKDLETKAPLTPAQRVGVEHYHDFLQRIPRKEVEAHGAIVQRAIQKVNPDMQVIVSGSYRRGAADSGDIDILITNPEATVEQIRELMVDTVIPDLFQQGFLQASLAVTSRGDGTKWHGASKLPDSPVWRRIDLLFVPGSEIGAALIYFTGNDIFNRSMRLLASKKGMRLNQRGLYMDVLRGPQRRKMNPGRLLEGRDERRIFEILGVPWWPPQQRIC